MLQTSLDFAQGTAENCKNLILGMFNPGQLLAFYKAAVIENKGVRDLVLWSSTSDPSDCFAGTRADYRKFLQQTYPKAAKNFGMYSQSAHSVAKVPTDTDAFWLVITVSGQPLPLMCVLYALKYEQAKAGEEMQELS